jgi:uncharacterized Zn finger protein (UPF0148 family)
MGKVTVNWTIDFEVANAIVNLGKKRGSRKESEAANIVLKKGLEVMRVAVMLKCERCGAEYVSSLGKCPSCSLEEAKAEVERNQTLINQRQEEEEANKTEIENIKRERDREKTLEEIRVLETAISRWRIPETKRYLNMEEDAYLAKIAEMEKRVLDLKNSLNGSDKVLEVLEQMKTRTE